MISASVERRLALTRRREYQELSGLTPEERARVLAEQKLHTASSAPGWMFMASITLVAGVAVLLQDYYMPHFQIHRDGSNPTPDRSLTDHLQVPVIMAMFSAGFAITGVLLAKSAPEPKQRRELHLRNAIAAGIGIIPGGLVGVLINLYNNKDAYNTNKAAGFSGGAAIMCLVFFAGCMANCSRDLPCDEQAGATDEEAPPSPR